MVRLKSDGTYDLRTKDGREAKARDERANAVVSVIKSFSSHLDSRGGFSNDFNCGLNYPSYC
jgi:hypothetical protein